MRGHKYQQLIYQSDKRFVIAEAGRRGGKTRANGVTAAKRIYQDYFSGKGDSNPSIRRNMPRLHYWCVAPDYALCQIQKREFYRIFGDNIQKDDPSHNRIWLYPEILVEFKSGENPNKLVAVGLNGLWITETARLKPAVWNDNLRPCLSDKRGWLLSDTTPLGRNWYVEEIADLADPTNEKYDDEYVIYTWKTIDNTMVKGLIEEVEKAQKSMPIKYFKRNYEACRDAFQGQIFDEFVYAHHVQDWEVNLSDYKIIVAGQDWGYTHNGAIVVIGITHDDNVDILHEVIRNKTLVNSKDEHVITWSTLAKEVNDQYNIELFYAGVDEPEHIKVLKDEGLPYASCNNNVKLGIQFVAMLLHIDENGRSILRVHKSCKQVAKEFQNYKWAPTKDGAESEVPLKIDDDAIDALRYGLYSARKWLNVEILKESNN